MNPGTSKLLPIGTILGATGSNYTSLHFVLLGMHDAWILKSSDCFYEVRSWAALTNIIKSAKPGSTMMDFGASSLFTIAKFSGIIGIHFIISFYH